MNNKINFHLILYEDENAFAKGASEFPLLFRNCFENIEEMEPGFDEELSSFCKIGYTIHQPNTAEEMKKIKAKEGFNVFLCGSHASTFYTYKSFSKETQAILQFDFHPDLRGSYKNDKNSHASFAKKIAEQGVQIFQVGVGESSIEDRFNAEKFNVIQFKSLDNNVINTMPKNIYVSFDADAFSFFSKVSTPSLSSLDESIFPHLHCLFKKKNIVAFDLVELLPDENTIMKSALFVRKLLFYKFSDKSTMHPKKEFESKT